MPTETSATVLTVSFANAAPSSLEPLVPPPDCQLPLTPLEIHGMVLCRWLLIVIDTDTSGSHGITENVIYLAPKVG